MLRINLAGNVIAVAAIALYALYGSIYGQNTYKRKIMTIDIDAAQTAMDQLRVAEQKPLNDKRGALEANIEAATASIENLNSKIDNLMDLAKSCDEKVADKSKIQSYADYYLSHIDVVPDNVVFKFCKEKDIIKAYGKKNPSEELTKLRKKFVDNELKRIKKGDLSSGFVSQLIMDELAQLNKEKLKQNNILVSYLTEKLQLDKDLINIHRRYRIENWNDIMDADPIPAIWETVEWKPIDGDLRNVSQLKSTFIQRFSSDTSNDWIASGKFDGLLPDNLSIIPSGNNHWISDYMDYYKSIKIVSDNGTVPELLINLEDIEGISQFEFSKEYGLSANIQTLNDIWDESGQYKDGIILSFSNDEWQGVSEYTWFCDNGEWVNTPPLNPKYMSFEKCQRELRKTPDIKNFDARDPDEPYEIYSNVKIFPVAQEWLNLKKLPLNEDNKIYFKTKPYLSNLAVPVKNYKDFIIWKDFGGNNDDAVMIIYEKKLFGKVVERTCDLYCFHWSGPFGYVLNGNEYDASNDWFKVATGKYNFDLNKWEIRRFLKEL